MRKNLIWMALAVATVVAAPSAGVFAAPHSNTPVIGKQGWVTIKSATKFGDTVLKPGTYSIEHERVGGTHVVTLQQLGDPSLALQYSDQTFIGQPVSVPCELETLPARAKKTVVTIVPDGTGQRITKIEIKGENVAHEL